MSKPHWMTIGSLESYEKTDSLKSLMNKFIAFCQNQKYAKGDVADIDKFAHVNMVGPVQLKMLLGILELRKYVKDNKILHNVAIIKDNFEFRSNRVAYLIKKHLIKHNTTSV